jgi:hypothetical protein
MARYRSVSVAVWSNVELTSSTRHILQSERAEHEDDTVSHSLASEFRDSTSEKSPRAGSKSTSNSSLVSKTLFDHIKILLEI